MLPSPPYNSLVQARLCSITKNASLCQDKERANIISSFYSSVSGLRSYKDFSLLTVYGSY